MLQTGDVVLFYDAESLKDRFLAWAADSPCSHVGIVIRNPPWFAENDREGVYLLESGWEGYADAEDHQVKFGVQMSPLEQAMANYPSTNIHVRRLVQHPEWTDEQLCAMHSLLHGKPYDTDPEHWARAFFDNRGGKPTDEAYWCSAMVTRALQELDVVKKDVNWTEVTPAAYHDLRDLPLEDGCKFGPIEKV